MTVLRRRISTVDGGGGGGAGTTGGAGGAGYGGTSGGAGGVAGINGGNGGNGASTTASFTGGGGGGGGAHGLVVTTTSTLSAGVIAGNGGNGGNATDGAGGGAGAGGYGVVIENGANPTIAPGVAVTAGNGGNGGAGPEYAGSHGGDGGIGLAATSASAIGNSGTITGGHGGSGGTLVNYCCAFTVGGNGGDGGTGVSLAAGSALVNTGTITGGDGGSAGLFTGQANPNAAYGVAGAGGVGVVGAGVTIINSGAISGGLSGDGVTRANAITFTGGVNTLTLGAGSAITGNVLAFSSADTLALGGSSDASFNLSQIGASAQYQGFGAFLKTGSSTWTLTGSTTATTNWTIGAGVLQLGNGGSGGSILGNVVDNGTLAFNRSNTYQFDGAISGTGGVQQNGSGRTILTAANTYSGPTDVNAGTLQAGAIGTFSALSAFGIAAGATLDLNGFNQAIGPLAGTGTVTDSGGAVVLTSGGDNSSTIFSGAIQDGAGSTALTKTGTGTLALTGLNSYSGATLVSGGTLQVDGSIASSSLTTVNAGATLTGSGTVGATLIKSGASFAPGAGTPGTSMTIAGNLAFQSGALYLVQLNASAATRAVVNGSATLAGSVTASFAAGTYATRSYSILHATSLGGSFATLTTVALPAGFTPASA